MAHDELGKRMKENYENRAKNYLTRRTPVIIRIDGKAFHTFTRGLNRPWDDILHKAMVSTLKYLCANIQGCKFGYTQSDEISLLLIDYDKLTTDAWFGYNAQKMCSISASMATYAFNKYFSKYANEYLNQFEDYEGMSEEQFNYTEVLEECMETGALFDSRCFSIPREEVTNYFIWRQQDATRNAIQMLGQTYFSHSELQDKNNNQVQDMLMMTHGVNFNDQKTVFKRGTCCIKAYDDSDTCRAKWVIDTEIPIFTQNRDYVEEEVYVDYNKGET